MYEPETYIYLSLPGVSLTPAEIAAIDTNIKAIKYGSGVTLSSLTAKFSTVAPTFVTQISQDLRWLAILNATVPITATWSDGTNTLAMIPVAAGTGETYLEKITDPTFDNAGLWTSGVNWSVTGGEAVATGVSAATQNIMVLTRTIGELYKGTIVCSNYTSGTFRSNIMGDSSVNSPAGLGTSSRYFTGTSTASAANGVYAANTLTAKFSDISISQVLTPSISGFTFSDGSGASFNPNAATFTLNIVRR
jgi:hypothetical protein